MWKSGQLVTIDRKVYRVTKIVAGVCILIVLKPLNYGKVVKTRSIMHY